MGNKRFSEIYMQFRVLNNLHTNTLNNSVQYKNCVGGYKGLLSRANEAYTLTKYDLALIYGKDEFNKFMTEWNKREKNK